MPANSALNFAATLRALLAAAVLTGVAGASPMHGNPSGSFAIKAKRILTASAGEDWVYAPGVIVVRDGKIVAVGSDLQVPADLPLLELRDATITPGLVAAVTTLAPPHTGDESLAAAYRAIDAFNIYGDYADTLAGGVTTVHVNPGGHRLLTGQGAVVRLGGPISSRVLREQADLTINLVESAYQPPQDVTYQTPASSDVAIPPPIRQRPDSRLGQFTGIEEAIQAALTAEPKSLHQAGLALAWQQDLPWRVHAQRSADLAGAISFLQKHGRRGYFVGGAEVDRLAAELSDAGIPLVYTLASGFRSLPGDLGYDPDVIEADIRSLSKLSGIPVALVGAPGSRLADLRVSAATARRAGFTERQVIEAVTRVPAEIIGVADRVGRLSPGMDADMAVFSADPHATSSHALLVYVAGQVAFQAPHIDALVVHAGTVWVDEKTQIHDGSVLVEDGKIAAVGRTVPHPPFARVIDAGPDGFVTPGFIDAFGHLGLDADKAALDPDISPASGIGTPDVTERRVAKAGITTVITAPYVPSGQASQMAAVRTAGSERAVRVVSKTAAVYFDLQSADPIDVSERLDKRLKSGKEYVEKWEKYEKELAEWKEKKAKGELPAEAPKEETDKTVEKKADPITGTWEVTLSGGPMPEPQPATMKLRLSGSDIDGRMRVPGQPEEAKITATFDGKHISGKIDVETPFGPPAIEADLVEEDHIKGYVAVAEIRIDLDARRTDKSDVEFKVTRRKTRGKHGEPLPPPIDEGLEPLRAVLEKRIPIAVAVNTEVQIAQALKVAKEFDVSIVLVDATGATVHADTLVERSAGVIVGKQIVRQVEDRWYHQADDLSRKGVAIAFQSDAEDAARALPTLALHAVERGLSPDAALAAFTTHPSRMFKLDGKIGSLRPGLLGDLVIFNGHPFEAGTRVQRVIINGEEVE